MHIKESTKYIITKNALQFKYELSSVTNLKQIQTFAFF